MSLPMTCRSAGQRCHCGADAGNVVGQRVDPDIHDVIGRAGHRHAPVEGGARHREVGEPALDEADHLVEARVRPDEVGMGLVMRQQPVLVLGQTEEIGLLLGPFDRRALGADADAVGADSGLVLGVIGLVADRIPALIAAEIDVAGRDHRIPDRLARPVVARLGGADEVVVGNREGLRHGPEGRGVAVGQLARRQPLAGRRLHHLQAVLVGAGQEEHVVTVVAHEARNGIGGDDLVGMADMRGAIGV